MHVEAEHFDMTLAAGAGGTVSAAVEASFEYRLNEHGDSVPEVRLVVRWDGREAAGASWNYFHALCHVRERLAPLGLTPRCYGACRNLFLSGMCLDMGLGREAYLVRLGEPADRKDFVRDIFAAGPDMDLATVAEQAAFKLEWLRSVGRGD